MTDPRGWPTVHHGELAPALVTCGGNGISTPRSTDWSVVTCRACLWKGGFDGSAEAAKRMDKLDADGAG